MVDEVSGEVRLYCLSTGRMAKERGIEQRFSAPLEELASPLLGEIRFTLPGERGRMAREVGAQPGVKPIQGLRRRDQIRQGGHRL